MSGDNFSKICCLTFQKVIDCCLTYRDDVGGRTSLSGVNRSMDSEFSGLDENGLFGRSVHLG
jgi:hypothetical protein